MTPLSGTQISIASGDYSADIATVGATLRSLRHRDRPLTLSFDEDEVRPRYLGATLIPWPNRIVDGKYRFDGAERQLALTEPERGHALHGLAVWLDFDIVEQSEDAVTLGTTVPAQEGYPHRIAVTVDYRLTADGLTCTTTGRNTGPSPAPFGTAPHPYFSAGPEPVDEWTLTLPASRLLETDERLSPLREVEVDEARDFRGGVLLGDTQLDTAFTGLERGDDGIAEVRIESPSGTGVALRFGEEYSWAQVFTSDLPEERLRRRGVAVEPMTCPPDAFNTGIDLIVLEPGEEFTGVWQVRAL
ncbi:aldose 1-epimerase family protein [Naasia aerilata]|uniref:Galactose mutarotase n=1 Tax=Naasia aerilata TaxID=1162966 RepID=A0ABN6XIP4_9MICO|nr:aldose 1-epimerase family protein [Naasia aerilata]BDZ44755.1 galactose mutarotase [Naasia aerilata]